MSAIAGIINFNKEPINRDYSLNMMKALEKFPADDIRVFQKDHAFLGCHAQWITPESIGEPLPFYDSERQCAITADAIIDNRGELFEKLQVDRAKRKTMPDSQLILLAYYKWGEESPKHLVGDFAFMIWDEREQKLFGARDFSGGRTLYYIYEKQSFAFCTIMTPLFAIPYLNKTLSGDWLSEFLAIPVNFESVDPSATVYKNIIQIPPSHAITVSGNNIRFTRYSYLEEGSKVYFKSDNEYEEALRDVFSVAVKSRLRTYHKVGAHLSGGLDSGSVASFAASELRKENKKLHTYSYIPVDDFKDFTHKSRIADERPYIKATVNHVGNIDDKYMDFKGKSPFSEIDEWLETMEMPYKFFENTFWLSGIYKQAQSEDIGVLLNGQRGNWTISWGPVLDYYATLFKRLHWFQLYRELDQYSNNLGVKKSRIIPHVRRKAFPSLYRLIQTKVDETFPQLIDPDFAKRTQVFEKLEMHGIDVTATILPSAYEVKARQFKQVYYWNTTGTYGSKLSLRYSLLDRDPTNDLRVINYCLSVPEEQYVRNGLDRSLIRRSTKGILPDKVRMNLRSRGVQGADGVHRMIPYWKEFIRELEELSGDSTVSGLLNIPVIRAAIQKIREPRAEFAFDYDFRILMRSLIVYRFIKNST